MKTNRIKIRMKYRYAQNFFYLMLNKTRSDESGSLYKDTSVACFQCSGINMYF